MDAYDPAFAPTGFGLNNTGVICYFNSFLQLLASCTSLTRAVLADAGYLGRTRSGAAVLAFVRAYAAPEGAYRAPAPDVAGLSARVLAALVEDLAARRPRVRFGGGMESASEALVHLLDMMEPPSGSPAEEAALAAAPGVLSVESPVTRLFLHRFRCDLHCRECRRIVSRETDYAVTFQLFHLDWLRSPPATVADFSQAVRLQVSATEDYKCPDCGAGPARAFRSYSLTMCPEIVLTIQNLYVGYGGARRARYFPDRLEFPKPDGGLLVYRLVGQVEHAGSLDGGHYWARGLRAGERVFLLNDSGVTPSHFEPTPNTYLMAYHYVGDEPAPAATASAPAPVAGAH
jgi:hypothetical protein